MKLLCHAAIDLVAGVGLCGCPGLSAYACDSVKHGDTCNYAIERREWVMRTGLGYSKNFGDYLEGSMPSRNQMEPKKCWVKCCITEGGGLWTYDGHIYHCMKQ